MPGTDASLWGAPADAVSPDALDELEHVLSLFETWAETPERELFGGIYGQPGSQSEVEAALSQVRRTERLNGLAAPIRRLLDRRRRWRSALQSEEARQPAGRAAIMERALVSPFALEDAGLSAFLSEFEMLAESVPVLPRREELTRKARLVRDHIRRLLDIEVREGVHRLRLSEAPHEVGRPGAPKRARHDYEDLDEKGYLYIVAVRAQGRMPTKNELVEALGISRSTFFESLKLPDEHPRALRRTRAAYEALDRVE